MSTLRLAEAAPAGGAALDQVLIASGFGLVGLVTLAVIAYRQRTGHQTYAGRAAHGLSKVDGSPPWAGFPLYLLIGSLLTAVFGMYWDISIHIDEGRDEGPLANPAHWFILVGLFGILVAGVLSAALADTALPRRTLRLPGGWRVPYGALLIAASGTFALLGFPLDDVWHRLFGQDVTLYGPTHLMLIGGATLSTAGGLLLMAEGRQVSRTATRSQRFLELQLAGAFLIGLSTFQAEFDFSVPQFRFVIEPVLLMVAAGIALTTARVRLGAGGAIGAVLIFWLVRGLLTFLVGGPLDQSMPHFPLYMGSALVVELVALLVSPVRRRLAFGLLSGLGIGTLGLASEWGWSHVWSAQPWPAALLPEAVVLGLIGALGGAVLGSWIGERLNATSADDPATAAPQPSRAATLAVPAGLLAAVVAIAWCVPITAERQVTVEAELTEVQAAPERTVEGTFRVTPAVAAQDAEWFNLTSWQGGGSLVQELREVSPGVYETTEPVPVHGNWKTTLRLHKGTDVLGLPVFMPEDEAIPAEEIPASETFTRDFVLDKKLLQREVKDDVAPWLWTFAYLVVGAITAVTLAGIGWGLQAAGRGSSRPAPAPYPTESPTSTRAAATRRD